MNIKNKRISRDAKFAIDKEVIWSVKRQIWDYLWPNNAEELKV